MSLFHDSTTAPIAGVRVQAILEVVAAGFRSFGAVVATIVSKGTKQNEPGSPPVSLMAPSTLIEDGHTTVRISHIHPGVRVVNPIGTLGNRIVGLVLSLRVAAATKWKQNRQYPVVTGKSSKLCPKVNPRQLVIKRNLLNALATHK